MNYLFYAATHQAIGGENNFMGLKDKKGTLIGTKEGTIVLLLVQVQCLKLEITCLNLVYVLR